MAIRRGLSPGPYLLVLFTGIVIAQFLDYLFRSQPWVFGQPPAVLVMLVTVAVSVLLWLLTTAQCRMTGLPLTVFLGMLVLWVAVIINFRLDNVAFTYAAITTPIILLMIIVKPPDSKEAWRLADFTFAMIGILSLLAQTLDWMGLREARTTIYSRWSLPLTDLDLGYRWEGFFGDPNNAGLMGAILVIYGLHRSGWLRGGLSLAGALIVLFSESRTSLVALAAGVLVTVLTSRTYRELNLAPWITALIAFATAASAVVLALTSDPSLNGRAQIWEAYLTLWQEAPTFGIGPIGLGSAISNGEIPWDTIDGHSVLIDSLTRHGVLVAMLIVAILLGALAQAWRAKNSDAGTSLSIIAAWLIGALTYTLTEWLYINVLIVPLILALLLAQARTGTSRTLIHD